ncbi:MAG: hypothetical protein JOS17DRAFT_430498 [Linnemannia elongata]|nr:MAG: hypothetical protein JOS17DRAFT_430498 [Linnemannia elongata]
MAARPTKGQTHYCTHKVHCAHSPPFALFLMDEVCIISPHPFFSLSFPFLSSSSFLPLSHSSSSSSSSSPSSSSPSSLVHLPPPPTHSQLPYKQTYLTQLHTDLSFPRSILPSYNLFFSFYLYVGLTYRTLPHQAYFYQPSTSSLHTSSTPFSTLLFYFFNSLSSNISPLAPKAQAHSLLTFSLSYPPPPSLFSFIHRIRLKAKKK